MRSNYVLVLSEASRKRFGALLEHYGNWQLHNPTEYPEQYLGFLYGGLLGPNAPRWEWAVEYVAAVIASVGTPPSSMNRDPRYSNRINRPSESIVHKRFWSAIQANTSDLSVLTTNYDILIERALRHQTMKRPPSPGCFYGGLPRPQHLKGAAQPFSKWSPAKLIEMTGAIPVYKLHGSLNWHLEGQTLVTYQDMRAAFRNGGNTAIIPPVPEKVVPTWLMSVWQEAEAALQRSDVWIVCGYSLPAYDTEVLNLLRRSSDGRSLKIFLISPDSNLLQVRWRDIAPTASIVPLPGLPESIPALNDALSAPDKRC